MTLPSSDRTIQLLRLSREGDRESRDALVAELYPWFEKNARQILGREHEAVTLTPEDLVQEVIVRILQSDSLDVADKAHFKAISARLMRRVLIDHARFKKADKRRHQKVTLITRAGAEHRQDLNDLSHALQRLGAIDREKLEIVEMRYFGGMSIEDISIVTGLSERTVKRRWSAARLWLSDALKAG